MLFLYIGVPMKFCGNLFVGTTIKLHHKVFLIHLANGSSGLNFGQARCYSSSIPVKYIPKKSRIQENECAYRDLPFLKSQNEKNEATYFVDNEEHNGLKMDLAKVDRVENSQSFPNTAETSSHVSLGGFNPGIEVDGTTRGQGRLHNGFKMDLSKVHKVENSQSYPKAETSSHVSLGGFNPDIEVDGITRGQGRLHNGFKMDLSNIDRVENSQSYLNTVETNSHVSLGGFNPGIEVDGTTRGHGRLHNGFKMDLSKVQKVENSQSYPKAQTSSHVSLGGFNPGIEVDGTTTGQGRLRNGFKMDLSKVHKLENSQSYAKSQTSSHVSLGGFNPGIEVDGTTRDQGRLHNGFKMDLSKVHKVEKSQSYPKAQTSSHVSLGGFNPDIEVDCTTSGQGRLHNGFKMDLSKVHRVENAQSYLNTAETNSHVSLGGLNPDIQVDGTTWGQERLHNGFKMDLSKVHIVEHSKSYLGTAETSSHVSLGGFNPDFEVDGTTMGQGRLHNGFKMDLSKVRRVENSESYLNIAETGSHVSLGLLNPDIDMDGTTRGQGRLQNGLKMDLSKVHRVENSQSYLNTAEIGSHVSLGGLNPDIEMDGTTRGQGRMHNGLKMDLSKVHSVENSESYRSTAETSSHISLGGLNPDIEVDDRIIGSNENGTIRDQGKLQVERAAIKLVGIRAYTAMELKKKLEQKKFLPGIIDAVVRDFRHKGLINDGLYAETLSRSRWFSSSWGPGRIKQALLEKGVSEVDVQKAIKLIFADEASGELDLELGMSKTSFDELYARTSKQWRRSENAPRHTRISRIVHWLQYRGYNMGVVKNMLKRLESTAEL